MLKMRLIFAVLTFLLFIGIISPAGAETTSNFNVITKIDQIYSNKYDAALLDTEKGIFDDGWRSIDPNVPDKINIYNTLNTAYWQKSEVSVYINSDNKIVGARFPASKV